MVAVKILYMVVFPTSSSFSNIPNPFRRRIVVQDQIDMVVFLVDLLAVEGNTEGAEQQSTVSVVCSGSVDSDVETRNHLGRVPFCLKSVSQSPLASKKSPKLTCHS